MKFLNVPVSVEARKGVPCRIRWGRRTYTVRRLLDFWILQSRWWAAEEKRVYFRLETDRGVVEVFRADDRERQARAAGPAHPGAEASNPSHPAPAPAESGAADLADSRAPAALPARGSAESAAPADSARSGDSATPRPGGPPPFVEGDTHTRELRQTESPYRPDAAALAGRRLKEAPTATAPSASPSPSAASPSPAYPSPWVLSKVID